MDYYLDEIIQDGYSTMSLDEIEQKNQQELNGLPDLDVNAANKKRSRFLKRLYITAVYIFIALFLFSLPITKDLSNSFFIAFGFSLFYVNIFELIFSKKYGLQLNHPFNSFGKRRADYSPGFNAPFRISDHDAFSSRRWYTNPTTGLPVTGGLGGIDSAGNPFGTRINNY